MSLPLPDMKMISLGLRCKCPQCGKGELFEGRFSTTPKAQCEYCGLEMASEDSGDGPAVFMIFILGFALVPIALIVDSLFSWPLWIHALVWGVLSLALTLGSLRPLRAYLIALQFKHRKTDWDQ